MSTFEMIEKSIDAKKSRGALTVAFVDSTKSKMDVFMMNDRITEDQYNELSSLLEVK